MRWCVLCVSQLDKATDVIKQLQSKSKVTELSTCSITTGNTCTQAV